MEPELRYALEDALSTQLSLLRTALIFETLAAMPLGPIERLQVSKQTASARRAVVVFWLELPSSGPWLLFAVDAKAEHMIVRPLAAHTQSPEADIEALALIVRATTDALLHGEPLPASEPSPDEPPVKVTVRAWPTRPAKAPRPPALRISGAYVGSTFAEQFRWQNGFALRVAWLWSSGPYLGVGFTFFPALRFEPPQARFDVERYPFSIHAGVRFPAGPFVVAAELGSEVELRNRRTLAAAHEYAPAPDQVKIIYNLCPKIEAQLPLTSWLVAFVGGGIDFVIGNFDYTVRDAHTGQALDLVEPAWLRPTIHVGLGIMR